MSARQPRKAPSEGRDVEVRLVDTKDIDPVFVNLAHVNPEPHIFQLVFSRVLNPIVTNSTEREQWKRAKYIDAAVEARLLITPLLAAQLIELLKRTLDEYGARGLEDLSSQKEDENAPRPDNSDQQHSESDPVSAAPPTGRPR